MGIGLSLSKEVLDGVGFGIAAAQLLLCVLVLALPIHPNRKPVFVSAFSVLVLGGASLQVLDNPILNRIYAWLAVFLYALHRVAGMPDGVRPDSEYRPFLPRVSPRSLLAHGVLLGGGGVLLFVLDDAGPLEVVWGFLWFFAYPLGTFLYYQRDPLTLRRRRLGSGWVGAIVAAALFSAVVVGVLTDFHVDRLAMLWLSLFPLVLFAEYLVMLQRRIDLGDRHAGMVAFLDTHDAHTNLPNRKAFFAALDKLIQGYNEEGSGKSDGIGAVLAIDIDYLRHVNDSAGDEMGNYILSDAARRIRGTLDNPRLVFRTGGDEFAVILEDLESDVDAAMAAEAVLSAFADPFSFQDQTAYVGVSIGVSLLPRDGESAADVTAAADKALREAKVDRNTYRFYTSASREPVVSRIQFINYLRQAIDRQEMYLQFQPQVDDSHRIVGAEALLRWHHPKLGEVSPVDFIPLAEESGLILPIGAWVIEQACEFLSLLHAEGFFLPLSVNLSPRQIKDSRLVRVIISHLRRFRLRPEFLHLEITENSLIDNSQALHSKLSDLADLGFSFAIDDFGIGYSSLSYLKRLPIREVKIDRSFITNLPGDAQDAAVVEAVVRMVAGLGLRVVAEGVDNQDQVDFLTGVGCRTFQGYLFSRALGREDFLRVLRSGPLHPGKSPKSKDAET